MTTCAVCGTPFVARCSTSRYCKPPCATAAHLAAKRERCAAKVTRGEHLCTVPGCGRRFLTPQALGGHQAHHPAAKRMAPTVRTVTDRTLPGGPAQCDECPQVCSTPAQLATHRREYHRPKPIPRGVALPGGMTFACHHCGRVYDDPNRLNHHLREIHDHGKATNYDL